MVHLLRASRRQARWVWVAAIIGGLGLEAWSLLERGQAQPRVGDAGAATPMASAASGSQASLGDLLAAPALEQLDPCVGVLWVAASAMLLTGLLGGLWRLHRRASKWPRHRVGSCDQRVLHTGISPPRYRRVLLGIGTEFECSVAFRFRLCCNLPHYSKGG
jgi:hypothetical protein